jgi:hypothetical protein
MSRETIRSPTRNFLIDTETAFDGLLTAEVSNCDISRVRRRGQAA